MLARIQLIKLLQIAFSGAISIVPLLALPVLAQPSANTQTTEPAAEETPGPETLSPDDGDKTPEADNPETLSPDDGDKTPEADNPETFSPEVEETRTPEEIERFQTFAEADRLYREGEIAAAEQLYRQVKPPFSEENREIEERLELFSDPTNLSPAGKVYWREYKAGWEQNLETRIFVPLKLLVEQYPEFIPGHLRLAEALNDYNRPEEALTVLERATERYPDEPVLLKAKIAAQVDAEKWLDASMAAREFALLNAKHPEAEAFGQLAEENLERFKSYLRRRLRENAIANVVTGALGYAFTGNIFGPLSALDTTILMMRGESAVGRSFSNRIQKQLPMVEDEDVLAYVNEMGQKLATFTGRDEFEYEFYIILDDKLNAFALPGGKIFIYAGAILKTNSEAELAGLVAHELSHAVLSHGFQLVTRGSLTSNVAQYIPYAGGLTSNLLVFSYSREMERQADLLGTRILASADYAADGMRNLMVTLEEEDKPSPPAWLSTHPDTSERISYLETTILRNGYNRYAYEGVEKHAEMQKRVKRLLKEQAEKEEAEEAEEAEELLDLDIRW